MSQFLGRVPLCRPTTACDFGCRRSRVIPGRFAIVRRRRFCDVVQEQADRGEGASGRGGVKNVLRKSRHFLPEVSNTLIAEQKSVYTDLNSCQSSSVQESDDQVPIGSRSGGSSTPSGV